MLKHVRQGDAVEALIAEGQSVGDTWEHLQAGFGPRRAVDLRFDALPTQRRREGVAVGQFAVLAPDIERLAGSEADMLVHESAQAVGKVVVSRFPLFFR